MNYQYIEDINDLGNTADYAIKKIEDSGKETHIPNDESNKDWNEFQLWLGEGNTPLAFE